MDERLQQLLRLISGLAGRSAACVTRGLAGDAAGDGGALVTYDVVPMSPRLGVMEFVQVGWADGICWGGGGWVGVHGGGLFEGGAGFELAASIHAQSPLHTQKLNPKPHTPPNTHPQGTTPLDAALKSGLSAKGHPEPSKTLAAAANCYYTELAKSTAAATSVALDAKHSVQAVYMASFAAQDERVIAAYRSAAAMLPWDCLREAALLRASATPMAFLGRRGAVARSAAAVAAAGWLAGVGDRHQGNILIEVGF